MVFRDFGFLDTLAPFDSKNKSGIVRELYGIYFTEKIKHEGSTKSCSNIYIKGAVTGRLKNCTAFHLPIHLWLLS